MEYLILGVIFYVVGIPVIEALSGLLVQAIEVLKGYLIIILSKQRKYVKSDNEETAIRAIGFSLPDTEEEEEDYDDDE